MNVYKFWKHLPGDRKSRDKDLEGFIVEINRDEERKKVHGKIIWCNNKTYINTPIILDQEACQKLRKPSQELQELAGLVPPELVKELGL